MLSSRGVAANQDTFCRTGLRSHEEMACACRIPSLLKLKRVGLLSHRNRRHSLIQGCFQMEREKNIVYECVHHHVSERAPKGRHAVGTKLMRELYIVDWTGLCRTYGDLRG